MTESAMRRFPGVCSFDDNAMHRRLFHGRDKDSYNLLQLILAERLVVLFARSGIGKSSIINAGISEPLRERGFVPMVVRVSSIKDDPLDSLYAGIKAACDRAKENGDIDAYEPADPSEWNRSSLWHFMKSFYVWRGDTLLDPVIVIDQFEELFTLISDKQRRLFIDQLADLVRGTRPQSVSVADEFSDRAPPAKVVLSIREEFMAHLQEMAERVPAILKSRLRLNPLTAEQAREAMVAPAGLSAEGLETPPFSWSDDALECALDFLRVRRSITGREEMSDEVEPFQLQLVCQYVEDLVQRNKLSVVSLDDLGGERALRGVLTRFYENTIASLGRQFPGFRTRQRIKRLCEYGFITARGRRLLREESTICETDGVSHEILQAMVEHRLIRREPRVGDNYYELTHDTLIEPILASREAREQTNRRTAWTSGAFLLVAAVVAGLTAYNNVQLQAQQRERVQQVYQTTAQDLLRHGRAWADQGIGELALAFFQAAADLDQTIDVEQERNRATDGESRATSAIEAAERVAEQAFSVFGTTAVPNGMSFNRRSEGLQPVVDQINRLTQTGKVLAARIDVDNAIRVFDRARTLTDEHRRELYGTSREPSRFPSEGRGDEIAATEIDLAGYLARAAYIEQATQLLTDVEGHSRNMLIDVWLLNTICWNGALFRNARDFTEICDEAVAAGASDPRVSGAVHDSRGLVRALSGDLEGARSDFEAYVNWAEGTGAIRSADDIDTRKQWIASIDNGREPIDDPTLLELQEQQLRWVKESGARLQRLAGVEMEASLLRLLEAWALEPRMLERLREGSSTLCATDTEDQIDLCDDRWKYDQLSGMSAIVPYDNDQDGEIDNMAGLNMCSLRLHTLAQNLSVLDEIFVTDDRGFNVCQSQKTEDYYQADEDWWNIAENWKAGETSERSKIETDGSTNKGSYSVYVAIRDPGKPERVLGVVKGVFDAVLLNESPSGSR